MKCWMLSAAMLLVTTVAFAQDDSSFQSDLEVVDEYSLDFSGVDAFSAPLPLEVEWLPPPAAFENPESGPGGNCELDFTADFEKSDFFVCPVPNLASDIFATLAAATEITKCESGTCACGPKCGCKSGDRSKCACGANCQCAKGACKCGKNCQCAKTAANGKCACGPQCQCGKTASVKVGRCGKGCPFKMVEDSRARFFAEIAARRPKCDCGASCACGKAENAQLKHELDVAYQQLRFEQRLAQMQSENQRREFHMLLELAEVRAQAAAHQAALEQQSMAHHRQQELVNHIVQLAGGTRKAKPEGDDHLRSRIEQLTIENVQLRHTIEELRRHVEHLARQPGEQH